MDTCTIAIFENSENKEAAKVLIDWYLSEHGKSLMGADARIMSNNKVQPPGQWTYWIWIN